MEHIQCEYARIVFLTGIVETGDFYRKKWMDELKEILTQINTKINSNTILICSDME